MKKTTFYLLASFIVNLILRQTVEAQSNSPYVTATTFGNGKTVVTITGPAMGTFYNQYLLASNQVVTVNTFCNSSLAGVTLYFNFASGAVLKEAESSGFAISKASEWKITGLTSIVLSNSYASYGQFPGFVTFTVDTPSTNSISVTPVNSVVIPSDATGPVQIILESSSDLVNWIPSLPGTYGSTYTNRFFRVRAVAQ